MLIVVAGGVIGAFAFLLRGSSDVLTKMVPSDASVYATVYLDPALGQKLALRDLVHRFPATDTSAEIDQRLSRFFDQGLQVTNLSFQSDIRPWVGSQAGVVVRIGATSTDFALLVASKDDAAAQAALGNQDVPRPSRRPMKGTCARG